MVISSPSAERPREWAEFLRLPGHHDAAGEVAVGVVDCAAAHVAWALVPSTSAAARRAPVEGRRARGRRCADTERDRSVQRRDRRDVSGRSTNTRWRVAWGFGAVGGVGFGFPCSGQGQASVRWNDGSWGGGLEVGWGRFPLGGGNDEKRGRVWREMGAGMAEVVRGGDAALVLFAARYPRQARV